eukprot:gene10194-13714_t
METFVKLYYGWLILGIWIVFVMIRLTVVLPAFSRKHKLKGKKNGKGNSQTTSTMIIFGSGGHTTEMIMLIKELSLDQYGPFYFVTAHSDKTTLSKIESSKLPLASNATWHTVHRSREVKQSWFTTLFTTAYASIQSFLLVLKLQPELIICNGPGTCVPICLGAFLLKLLGLYSPIIIFIESFCRVKKLSFSGMILYHISDRFIVQWPQLLSKYSRAEYLGEI